MHKTRADFASQETIAIPVIVGDEVDDADRLEQGIVDVQLHSVVLVVGDRVVERVLCVEGKVNDAHDEVRLSSQSGSGSW